MEALAPAGRSGLEPQTPAPVGRQQRRHVQHAGLYADPCQSQRAPLLQLPGRSLPGLITPGPGTQGGPFRPFVTTLAGTRDRGLPERGQPQTGAGRLPWPAVQTLLENSCTYASTSTRAGELGAPPLEDAGGTVIRLLLQRVPFQSRARNLHIHPDWDPVVFSEELEESNCPSSKFLSSEGEEVLFLQITHRHNLHGA